MWDPLSILFLFALMSMQSNQLCLPIQGPIYIIQRSKTLAPFVLSLSFFEVLFTFIEDRQKERQRKTLYVWSTFQMATIVSTELLRKQEPGARHVCLFVCLVVLSFFFFPEFSQLVQGAKFLDHVPLLSLATSMEMKWKWNSQDLKQHRYRIPVFARGGSTS